MPDKNKDKLDPKLLKDLKAAMETPGKPADLPTLQIEGRDFDTIVTATDKKDKD